MAFLYCISRFEGTFLVTFISSNTSRSDIIFHKFLELHSAVSEKKIFVMNFPFLMDSLKAPTPLMAPTPLKICYS